VQLLLESGADVHSRDNEGNTPLHMASILTDGRDDDKAGEITRLLLKRGAIVDAKDDDGATPLLLAACGGYFKTLQILLIGGADPNVKNNGGETALHRSLEHSSEFGSRAYGVARILLEHGAKPNVADEVGETPLHLAFKFSSKHCESSTKDEEVSAAKLVWLLLAHGADVNVQDKDKRTPLQWAIELKMYEITRVLLDRGAEHNVKNEGGKTALHLLLEGESSDEGDHIPKLARLLLDRGVDVNAQDQNHAMPLLLAAERHMDDIAQILLERGADPNAKNIWGKTPLHLLLERNINDHDDVGGVLFLERLLLDHGADVNAQAEDNTTPLHLASNHHTPEIAQIILNHANEDNDVQMAQLDVTLEGEYNLQSIVAVFHIFY
jgi:ankyrin repeat protein